MTNGPDLRRERRLHDVSVTDLARTLGVSRQTVHTYERLAAIDPDLAARYRTAVRELASNGQGE